MSIKQINRSIWLGLMLLLSTTAFAITPQEALNKLMASSSITPQKTAVLVYDLATGNTVAAYNDGLGLVPASVMKTVTAASFAEKYKYSDRLKTKVYTTGNLSGGTLQGDIVVEGSGDPSINRETAGTDLVAEIVDALKNKGITAIEGTIKVDNSFIGGSPTHPTWASGDLTQSYGTGYHAFNYQGNASGKAAVTNPDKVFISHLKTALAKNGITLNGKSFTEGKRSLLMTHESQMLSNILRACLHRSDNLYAEGFLRLFGKKMGTNGSTEESAGAQMDYLERRGYPMSYVTVVDGSGLSRSNRLTVDFLGEMLGEKSEDPMFVSLLPHVGQEGTVKAFLKGTPLEGRLVLKTGSMNGIQAYAGYKLDNNLEPSHVIAVIANDLKNRDQFRKALAQFFMEIFAQ